MIFKWRNEHVMFRKMRRKVTIWSLDVSYDISNRFYSFYRLLKISLKSAEWLSSHLKWIVSVTYRTHYISWSFTKFWMDGALLQPFLFNWFSWFHHSGCDFSLDNSKYSPFRRTFSHRLFLIFQNVFHPIWTLLAISFSCLEHAANVKWTVNLIIRMLWYHHNF